MADPCANAAYADRNIFDAFNASKSYVFGASSCTRTDVAAFNLVLDGLPDDAPV